MNMLHFRRVSTSIMGLFLLVGVCYNTGYSQASPELSKKIKKAIKKGVGYLKKTQRSDGSWSDVYTDQKMKQYKYPSGETALALFALAESGVDPQDPVMQKAIRFLINQPFRKTYSVSIAMMAVESLFTPKSERKQVAQWVNGQASDFDIKKRNLSPSARKWMVRAASWLLGQMKEEGAWTYDRRGSNVVSVNKSAVSSDMGFVVLSRKGRGDNSGYRWDHSNSQYAVLGLHSASRCGVLIHNRHWKQILNHWVNEQAKDGPPVDLEKRDFGGKNRTGFGHQVKARHWWYKKKHGNRRDKYEMTCGGIGSIQIALHHLQRQNGMTPNIKEKAKKSVTDGLAYLQHEYSKYPRGSLSGQGGLGDYYTLYAFERGMMLTRTQKLNKHDWYVEGAKALVNDQKSNGSWKGRQQKLGDSRLVETCFALLFLKRATLPVTTPD